MTADRHILRCAACTSGRRGALLMELIAAMALFGVVLTIAVPVVTRVAAVREENRRRQVALLELGNLFEQIAARRRGGESTVDISTSLQLAPETAESLPDAELTVAATPQADTVNSTLVTARLVWTTSSGRPAAPAELSACFAERPAQEAVP